MKLLASILFTTVACVNIAVAFECNGTHLIGAGLCCFDVPCGYIVVQTSSWIDAWVGYLEPPDHSWRVTWRVGLVEKMLDPKVGRRIVWKHDDKLCGEQWTTGLVEEKEKQMLVMSDGIIELAVRADTINASDVLKRVAALRIFRKEGIQCMPPSRSSTKGTF